MCAFKENLGELSRLRADISLSILPRVAEIAMHHRENSNAQSLRGKMSDVSNAWKGLKCNRTKCNVIGANVAGACTQKTCFSVKQFSLFECVLSAKADFVCIQSPMQWVLKPE